MNMNDKLMPK